MNKLLSNIKIAPGNENYKQKFNKYWSPEKH